MSEFPAPARIDSLTALRGLLAAWVVCYHFSNDLIRLFPGLLPLVPFFRSGHLAVPGFFALSGFVLAHNYAARLRRPSARSVVRFWAMRLARIYPVHLVTLLTVAVMVAVAGRLGLTLTNEGYTARDFVLNLFLVHTWVPDFHLNWNYPSWSISSEWFAYITFPLVAAWLLPRVTTRPRAAVLAAACLIGTLVVYLPGPFPFRELVCVIPTFLAGVAAFALTRNRPPVSSHAARFLPELLGAAAVGACFVPGQAGVTLTLAALLTLVWALARLGDRPHRLWLRSGLLYLGEVSYSLYMTHTLAQKVLYKVLPSGRFEDAAVGTRLLVALVYLGLVAAWCLVTYYLVERPGRNWFRRRLGGRETGSAGT